ncbi:hypothetical protein Tco_1426421 [Tanacetum coccineum]
MLMLRDKVKPRVLYKIGNGRDTSAWHDKWCQMGPLDRIVSNRDLYDSRLAMDAKIADIITNNRWNWPDGWVEEFPDLEQIPNLVIDAEATYKVCWVNSDNKEVNFSTKVAWLSLRDNGSKVQWSRVVCYSAKIWERVKVKGKMENANSNLYKVVDKISERPSNNHIWRIIQRLIVSASVYFIWQERNKRLFQNEERAPDVLCRNIK